MEIPWQLTEFDNKTLEAYLYNSFLEQFKLTSAYGVLSGLRSYYREMTNTSPHILFHLNRNSGLVFQLVPMFNKLTHMMCFDIDNHRCGRETQTQDAAIKIYQYLSDHHLHPELALSSTGSNYRVTVWSERPQSVAYCNKVQLGILQDLQLDGFHWIEIFPTGIKALRPWHFTSGRMIIGNGDPYYEDLLDIKGCGLIKAGYRDNDFSSLKRLLKSTRIQRNHISTYVSHDNVAPSINRILDINQFLVKERGTRHDRALKFVRACKRLGLSLDDCLILSEEIHNGSLSYTNTSLNEHLSDVRRTYRSCKPSISVKSVLDGHPNLSDYELFNTLHNQYPDGFCLTVRAYGEYRGIIKDSNNFSQLKKCHRILKRHVKYEILNMVEPGKAGQTSSKANKYTLGKNIEVLNNRLPQGTSDELSRDRSANT